MPQLRRRRAPAALFAFVVLPGCQTDQAASTVSPPDHKGIILANKGLIWKDPDSIKNASISAPRRHMGFMWHVCVRANARGGFGGYTGEKDMLVGIYDSGKPPSVLMTDASGYCDHEHEPFPEIEGGYKTPSQPRPRA